MPDRARIDALPSLAAPSAGHNNLPANPAEMASQADRYPFRLSPEKDPQRRTPLVKEGKPVPHLVRDGAGRVWIDTSRLKPRMKTVSVWFDPYAAWNLVYIPLADVPPEWGVTLGEDEGYVERPQGEAPGGKPIGPGTRCFVLGEAVQNPEGRYGPAKEYRLDEAIAKTKRFKPRPAPEAERERQPSPASEAERGFERALEKAKGFFELVAQDRAQAKKP